MVRLLLFLHVMTRVSCGWHEEVLLVFTPLDALSGEIREETLSVVYVSDAQRHDCQL
jgi:hypothetical protein